MVLVKEVDIINKQRMLKNFLEFVQIDSETRDEFNFMKHLVAYLESLGLSCYTDNAGSKCDSNGSNIYVTIPGNDKDPILLSAHLDTVKPGLGIIPEVKGDIVVSKSDTILGADDKAGIAIILEAVETILEQKLNHKPIELLFTIFEEGGLHGAKNAEYDRIKSDKAIIFDVGGKTNKIVNQAPAQYNLEVKIIGKPSHAGGAPEKGINALTVASRAIQNMKLGRIDFETTSNIGVIHGGLATNIVMPDVTLNCEARSLNNDKLQAQVKHMEDTFTEAAEFFGAKVEINTKHMYSANKTETDHPFALEVKSVMEQLMDDVEFVKAGGGSDGNVFATRGIKCLLISAGLNNPHTLAEFLDLETMYNSTEFLLKYLTN